MAGRIKGITVEIGGDTTGLDKALKMNATVNASSSTLLSNAMSFVFNTAELVIKIISPLN